MTSTSPASPDFIRLNGETVRVTSLVQDEDGARHLVVILRGSRDTEQLLGILGSPTITIGIDGQPDEPVIVGEIDRRVFGEGQSAITRLDVALHPAVESSETAPAPLTLEERVSHLESTVANLVSQIGEMQRNPH